MCEASFLALSTSFPDEFDRSSPEFRLEGQTGDSVLSGAGFRTFSQEAALEPNGGCTDTANVRNT